MANGESLTFSEAELLVRSQSVVDALRLRPHTAEGHYVRGKITELSDFGLSEVDVLKRLAQKVSTPTTLDERPAIDAANNGIGE